jgi:hypothetical protein
MMFDLLKDECNIALISQNWFAFGDKSPGKYAIQKQILELLNHGVKIGEIPHRVEVVYRDIDARFFIPSDSPHIPNIQPVEIIYVKRTDVLTFLKKYDRLPPNEALLFWLTLKPIPEPLQNDTVQNACYLTLAQILDAWFGYEPKTEPHDRRKYLDTRKNVSDFIKAAIATGELKTRVETTIEKRTGTIGSFRTSPVSFSNPDTDDHLLITKEIPHHTEYVNIFSLNELLKTDGTPQPPSGSPLVLQHLSRLQDKTPTVKQSESLTDNGAADETRTGGSNSDKGSLSFKDWVFTIWFKEGDLKGGALFNLLRKYENPRGDNKLDSNSPIIQWYTSNGQKGAGIQYRGQDKDVITITKKTILKYPSEFKKRKS